MIRNVNTMFPEMNACKTAKGAQNRIDRFLERIADTDAMTGPRTVVLTQVVQREDGMFIPVAIFGSEATYLGNLAVHLGIGVTNVC